MCVQYLLVVFIIEAGIVNCQRGNVFSEDKCIEPDVISHSYNVCNVLFPPL